MSLLVIVITAGSFILNAVMGVLKGWTYPEQVAVLLIASTVCGLLYRKSPTEIAESFAKGCQSMGFVAFIIGLGGGHCADHDPGKYSPHHGQCSGCTAHACEQRLRHHCHVLV